MEHKKLICLALVFVFTFSVFAVIHFTNAATGPIISIVPTGDPGANSTTIISTVAIGQTFSVDVRVDDYAGVNIGGTNNGVSEASYIITWNPAVLEYVSYSDGTWLPSQSNAGDLQNNVANGQITFGQIAFGSSSFLTADSASGSVSATITFQVVSNSVGTTIGLEQQGANVPFLGAPETVGGLTSNHGVPNVTAVNAQYGTVSSPTPTPTSTPTPTPTVNVTSSANPGMVYQNILCTASVSGTNPTGSIFWSTSSNTGTFSSDQTVLINGATSTNYIDSSMNTVVITAIYSGDSNNAQSVGSTSLTITHGIVSSVTVSPATGSLTAGTSKEFFSKATDAYGNSWDVTSSSIWNASAGGGGSWSGNTYTADKAGNWVVNASYDGVHGTAQITVTHGAPSAIIVSPEAASVNQQQSVSFNATATDLYGNNWDVTSLVQWEVSSSADGSWRGNVYNSTNMGNWVVTASYDGLHATAQLGVYYPIDFDFAGTVNFN